MNIFTFKDSGIDVINSTSTTTSKIINLNTKIDIINLNAPLSILDGEFNSQINIITDCTLSLDPNFLLIDSQITLINTDTEEKNITIVGTLNNFFSNLKINSDNNIILNLAISTKDSSFNTVDINLNPSRNENDSFRLNSFRSVTLNEPKINFVIIDTKNIILDATLNTFDAGTTTDMNLVVSERSDIKEFQNIDSKTFTSVTASEKIIELVETSSIAVPITSLFFKVNIKDGKGYIFIPLKRDVQNEPLANIILNAKSYPI